MSRPDPAQRSKNAQSLPTQPPRNSQMATAVGDRHPPSLAWSASMQSMNAVGAPNPNLNADAQGRQRSQNAPPYATGPFGPAAVPMARTGTLNDQRSPYNPPAQSPPRNEVEMTRAMLVDVLEHFSKIIPRYFDISSPQSRSSSGLQGLRFVVHGGACMLLHSGLHALSKKQEQASPGLLRRTTTRDVDYIHRGFMAEYGHIPDAAQRLKECIRDTANHFKLGLDWMNSDADVALPMAHHPSDGRVFDPIYTASVQEHNINLHTIYRSANGLLHLISVTPFWAVSLKLVRYSKWDPGDICLLLRNGTILSNVQWTPELLETWLHNECWAMGYANFDARKKAEMRSRIDHAIQTLAEWNMYVGSGSSPDSISKELSDRERRHRKRDGRDRDRDRAPLTPHDAMGGGAVVGGNSAQQQGWSSSFGPWPNQPQQHGGPDAPFVPGNPITIPPTIPMPAPGHGMPLARTDNPLHVSNWGSSRSKSRSRQPSPRSKSRSRPSSPEPSPFIPPGINLDSDDERGLYGDEHSDPFMLDNAKPHRRARNQPNQDPRWANYNPNYAPVNHLQATVHASTSGGAWNAPGAFPGNGAAENGALRNPYAMDGLNRAVGAIAYGNSYNEPQPPAHRRNASAGVQPVIPPLIQQQLRKKQDKERHKERNRARGSKWGTHASEAESESSGSDSDSDENKENRDRARRGRRDDRQSTSKRPPQAAPWHNIYAPAAMDRSGSNGQVQEYHNYQYPPDQYPPDQSRQQRAASRGHAESRNRSPDRRSASRRRPAPLDLPPPPVIPNEVAAMLGKNPSLMQPSELAQLQFEQQQREYHRDRQQQSIMQQREHAFYDAARASPSIKMQQQQRLQQQQQQQHLYARQQHQRSMSQGFPPPPSHYQFQQQQMHPYMPPGYR